MRELRKGICARVSLHVCVCACLGCLGISEAGYCSFTVSQGHLSYLTLSMPWNELWLPLFFSKCDKSNKNILSTWLWFSHSKGILKFKWFLMNEFSLTFHLHFSVFNVKIISVIMLCAERKQEALQGGINQCTNQSRDKEYSTISNYHLQIMLLTLPALWIIIPPVAALKITIIISNINSKLYQLCDLSHLLYTFIN